MLVHGFQSSERNRHTRLISFTLDWGGLTGCESGSLVHLIWLGPGISTIGYEQGRHPQNCILCWIIRTIWVYSYAFWSIQCGASFCCLMEMCLGDQQYLMLLFYLDDFCIFGSSVDEMLDRIAMVLQCLKDFNLKIKPKISFFFQWNILFLGHMLSKDGILPNSEKVSKVKNWPILKMTKGVHSFLGLASYYWRFIPKLAEWANPLHNLIHPIVTKKKRARMRLPPLTQDLPPFRWDSEHQESIDRLKEALISSPILAYPDYNKSFMLETDASLKGLGAVLMQEDDDGNFCIISYASHTLKPYERLMWNYSSAKLELLTLKWAVCDKFRDNLIGSKFTVLTDNNPLTYVCTSHLGMAQIRWLSDLTLFDFEIKYRAGKTNQAADALSRQPENPNSSS